jgi:hypothetical protein
MTDFDAETKDDIRDAIVEILRQCEDDGMKFPVILCAVSPNGSIYASRFDGQGRSAALAEHFEGGVFPMTIMVLDQHNVAAKITINHSGNVVRQ